MKTIGERLKEARKSLGINQDKFCELVGVSRRTQSDYENGRGYPDAYYLSILHQQGIDINYIITGERYTGINDLMELQQCVMEVEEWLKTHNKTLTQDQLLNAAKQLFRAKQDCIDNETAKSLIIKTAVGF